MLNIALAAEVRRFVLQGERLDPRKNFHLSSVASARRAKTPGNRESGYPTKLAISDPLYYAPAKSDS